MNDPSLALPIPVGSRKTYTPTQLAERAIETIDCYETGASRRRKRGGSYGFFMDHKGRAWLDRVPVSLEPEWLMTITRKTDPDAIADEIRGAV